MSEAKFTPGPLVVDVIHGKTGVYANDVTGSIVADFGPFAYAPRSDGERTANARLYAAAPDLYEALELTLDSLMAFARVLGALEKRTVDPPAAEYARKALAKAVQP